MKIVRDEINKIKYLDKRYDKLADSDNTEKKNKLGDKISKLRNTVVEEFDRRKDKFADKESSFLDEDNELENVDETEDSKKAEDTNKWDKKSQKLDDRLAELDALLDPSLIHAVGDGPTQPNVDESDNTRHGHGKGKSTESHHKDKAERQADREERRANRKGDA